MNKPNISSAKHEEYAGNVTTYQTMGGGQIFRIPVCAFPGLWSYVYIVVIDNYRILIDTGSGIGESNQNIEAGLRIASNQAGMDLMLHNLTHILITHGHIDHYGGLSYIRPLTSARLGIHELDQSIVTNHVERLSIVVRRLEDFLGEAGVSPEKRGPILDMYRVLKGLYQPVAVDFTYEAQGMRIGPLELLHVPGHCPGHVVIRLHDVLFSGDHILAEISPHQSPERITPSTGLEHYLKSLEALRPWAKEIHLTLGGHENPITDLEKRLEEIRILHLQRLQKILDILVEPLTIAELSCKLFGEVKGYNILLALEETGAHVEYLHQYGRLRIVNFAELDKESGLMPVRYQCIDHKSVKHQRNTPS